jgi:signal transduction histidine kinase
MAGETMERLRRLAQDLRPPALDTVGLNHTLRGLCQAFSQRTRLVIDYQGQELPELSEALNITLYRFLQEALTNVAKHASARQVWVTVNYDAEAIRMMVRDDGRGFDPRAERWQSGQAAGMGLLGMRERLSALGGWLEVVSEPGKDTSVIAFVPLEQKNNA